MIEPLLELILLLFTASQAVRESSMVGESEFDRECRRWWWKVVAFSVLGVGLIAAAGSFVFLNWFR